MKAVGLLSGGLDSTLAAKMLIGQGVEIHAVNFTTPFCTCTAKGASCAAVVRAVEQLGNIPLKRWALGDEYLRMVANPRHGYGRGINPCIDCRILKIVKAGELMREIGASFLFTGEVLGQRPMSQHRKAIEIIDQATGLGDVTLRPLSAQHFEPTRPEREGWVDRSKLLSLSGRNRKPQIAMAADMGIVDYPCPAGGCKLTDVNFAPRLKDYFFHTPEPRVADMALLKIGRHFRTKGGDKIMVTRDEAEGEAAIRLARPADHVLVPLFSGPVTVLQGSDVNCATALMLTYTRAGIDGELAIEHRYDGSTTEIRFRRSEISAIDETTVMKLG